MKLLDSVKGGVFWLFKTFLNLIPAKHVGRFDGARKAYNFVVSRLKPRTAVIHGHTIHLDPLDSLALSVTGTYEPFESAIFESLLHSGDIVLDIGANIGLYTLLAARKVGLQGKVYAFEPDPQNYALLVQNVQENKYSQVFAVNQAVSDQSGTLTLYRSPINWGDHRLFPSDDQREAVTIAASTLDAYVARQGLSRIHAIKMDIQGAEGQALKGMKETLHHQPTLAILTEFWPQGLTRAGTPPDTCLQLLLENTFQLHAIFEDQKTIEPLQGEAGEIAAAITSRVGIHHLTLLCLKNLIPPKIT